MARNIVPMIHVPDVRATVAWYESIGFYLAAANEDCGEMDWASMTYGDGRVMFSAAGRASDAARREVDLYVYSDDIDALRSRLDGRAEIVEEPHDTFYGMREFIVRDCNRFWVTFGQQLP
ncbi:hypothetical protein FCE95_11485 [Luteimonas gilva]|uniref:Glyoxalase/fosfomycin resistance/dioxygenase domain-containing protein n=1 Tax=Luteimonas gilva TaxID=2572684 RepID=A0A4U5JN96_9GAMM|nr:VOC family protein [Luteimonas gilva]TKR30715.1 hypothetical protein FCE95_11485 [Luteimonas gilva]